MSTLFGSSSAASSQNTLGDLSKDVAVTNPPEDSVSDIAFSTVSQHLAVASWDKKVRIYEVTASGGTEGKAYFDHEAPVLSCHWSKVYKSETWNYHRSFLLIPGVGWYEGSRRRGRQSRADYRSRSRPKYLHSSCSTRPTHSHCKILRQRTNRRADACYWLLGQDNQVLGLASISSCCNCELPGTGLLNGCQG